MEFLTRFLVFVSLFTGLVSGFALQKLPLLQFDEGYTQLFGDQNLIVHRDGKSVRLTLDERTGLCSCSVPLTLFCFSLFLIHGILLKSCLQVLGLSQMIFTYMGSSVLLSSYQLITLQEL